MKFFKSILYAASMLCCACVFVSCDNNEPEASGSIGTPEYEQYAAKYDITSAGSDIKSIELTSSGNYIVIKKSLYPYGAKSKDNAGKTKLFRMAKSSMMRFAMESRSTSGGIIEGRYTTDGSGVYVLAGFGTIKVKEESGSVASLDIEYADGQQQTLTAAISNQLPESPMTDKLCRTWNAEAVSLSVRIGGKEVFSKERPSDEINQLLRDFYKWMTQHYPDDSDDDFEDEFDEDEMPVQVIFSKAGTYMVKYKDSSLAIATWSWANQSQGRLRYSWDYDGMYDDDTAGVVTVQLSGDKMKVVEMLDDESDDEPGSPSGSITFAWIFSQQR